MTSPPERTPTLSPATGAVVADQKTRAVRRRIGPVLRSAWGFTGALLVIVLGSVMLVDEFHDRADEKRRAQVAAGELEQDAAELRIAAETLMTSDELVASSQEIFDELRDLSAIARDLRGLGDEDVAAVIEEDLRAVGTALRSQVALVLAGDKATAKDVAQRRTVPALDALDDRVGEASDQYEGAAQRASRLSDIGLWVSVLSAGLAIGGLSWRHERARRASQRQMEQRLRERVAEVAEITERHRQLEAMKYSFVTAVSHELRTPLTAIQGSLEMLEDDDAGPLPPVAARVVSVAARGTRRLASLVEEIIDLERLESGLFDFYPARYDIHGLLREIAESLAPLTEGAGVALVLDGGHAEVLCDGDRVLQALTNLVGNAIKFSEPGGSIYLGVVHHSREVEVTVGDQGRGIPSEQLDAVFDRFHQVDTQADRAKGGAGLGLTITRQIIEAQGGRIWVESQVGEGTTFHFTLPSAVPEPDDPSAQSDFSGQSKVATVSQPAMRRTRPPSRRRGP